jgi:hypothetical protein
MSIKIQSKHSATKDKAPQPTDLIAGELAVNIHQDSPAIYLKDSAGAVRKIAGTGSVGMDWSRTGTELAPANAGDSVFTSGAVKVGGTTAAPNMQLKADGGIVANTNGLVYDAATKRLGIGTTSPGVKLTVVGSPGDLAAFSNATDASVVISANSGVAKFTNDAASGAIAFGTGSSGTERARIDSSGRLLVGTSTSTNNIRLDQKLAVVSTGSGNFSGVNIATYGGTGAGTGSFIDFSRSRGTTDGSFTSVAASDALGYLVFRGATGSQWDVFAQITAEVDGTPATGDAPGRLVFSTTADGASSPTERMRIASGGRVSAPSWYDETTAGAANVYVASTGILQRSTSSIKYKTNVETIEDSYSDALLNCRPVWYRSTCANDNPNYGWWGFIAEEVAEIDPRLCFFEQKEDGNLEPEGVAYDRFVPHLLNLIKRQGEAIAELQAEVAALKGA